MVVVVTIRTCNSRCNRVDNRFTVSIRGRLHRARAQQVKFPVSTRGFYRATPC